VTEREVVLARTGVPDLTITGSESHTFVNNVTTALGPLNRGYALVDATLDGTPFQFVSMHLDSTKSIGEAQAGQLPFDPAAEMGYGRAKLVCALFGLMRLSTVAR
jgi:hypothetical protein